MGKDKEHTINEIPEEFKDSKDLKDSSLKNGENNYLKYLTYKGAEKRYEKIDKTGFGFLLQYAFRYKSLLFQLLLGMLFGSMIQLLFPFLTQAVVDIGIGTKSDISIGVFNIFRENNITIPFPQVDLNVKEPVNKLSNKDSKEK